MADLEDIKISELPETNTVNESNDYLILSKPTEMSISDYVTYKVHPSKLPSSGGSSYTAGDFINISSENVISATYQAATTTDDGLMSSTDKTKLNGLSNYTLPTATSSVLGGIKVGTGLSITDGVVSVDTIPDATTSASGLMSATDKTKLNGLSPYTLPKATSSALGGVIVGSGISVDSDGVISASSGSSTLSGLTDVTITSVADGQVLTYDSANSRWENKASGGSGATTLGALNDVTISSVSGNQALIYDSNSSEWINSAIDYTTISNTPSLATVATSGDYADLTNTPTIPAAQVNSDWNAVSGIAEILNKPTIPDGLADLTDDVNISSPTDGQILKYDGTSSKWINSTGGGGGSSWTDVTGTLSAGSTSLTLQNAAITTSSTIDYYTDTFGVNPTNAVVTTGQIVLTFESQANNVGVKVRVS